MTHQQLVDAVAADPAVREALTQRNADGSISPPSAGVLVARASLAAQFAVAEVLNWTWVKYQIAVRKTTLTLTDNTYSLDNDKLEIVALTIGTDKRPIFAFFDPSTFVQWRYLLGQDAGPGQVDDPDVAERYHIFDRDSDGKRVLTFEPGIGSETTAELWYLTTPAVPFNIDIFPAHIHGYVYLVAVNYATGFQLNAEVARIKAMTEERVTNVHGTLDPIPQDPLVEERAMLRNRDYSNSV